MLHPSRIFVGLLVLYLFMIAIFLRLNTAAIPSVYLWPSLVLCLFFWRSKGLRYFLLAVFVVHLALFQSGVASSRLVSAPLVNGTGTVVAEPKISNYTQTLLVRLDSGQRAMIYVPTYPVYMFGDVVDISGPLALVAEDKYYQENKGYFLVRGVSLIGKNVGVSRVSNDEGASTYHYARQTLVRIRKKYELVLKGVLPEPYAGLAIGIFLGTKSEVPDDLNNLFIALGVVHIMALSGYNITVIADNLRRVAKNISVNFAFYFALSGIWLFVLATGLSASVVRAAIMGSLLLLSRKLGRQADAFIAILLAATVMVALNPYVLIYDLGFQLSFTAMCGLIFLAPRLKKMLEPLGKLLSDILATTVAAQIFTLPLLCYYFERVSLISILANVLIMPIVPLIMVLSFMVGSVGLISLWLAQKLGFLLWLILGYVLKIATILGSVPGIERGYKMGPIVLAASYFILWEISAIISVRKRVVIEEN